MLSINNLRVQHVGPLTFTVKEAECVVISGASGSGKSLLMRAIADLIPHEGEVSFNGTACRDIPAPRWRQMIGYLPAESAWWSEYVGEHFDSECKEDWLALFGFTHAVLDWEVSRCSSGERQRLALLRLLCHQPSVLLLDEPTASLDAQNIDNVEALIRQYQKEHGAPVLWVSHDALQIGRVASRQFKLEQGELIGVGS